MLYSLNLLALTIISHSCDHYFSNQGDAKLSPSQVFLKCTSISNNFHLISFELLNIYRDPKVLGYPLTWPLNQTLGKRWRGSKLNDNTTIYHRNKEMLSGKEWSHSLLPIFNVSCSKPASLLTVHNIHMIYVSVPYEVVVVSLRSIPDYWSHLNKV